MPTTFARDSSDKQKPIAVKSLSFTYTASEELSSLFEDFRLMCNDAIRMAVKEKPRNRFDLQKLVYHRIKGYGLHTHYVLSACEVAYSVYRNKNRRRVPYIRRSFVKLDNDSYQLNHLLLRIPTAPRRFIFLSLQGSDYHASFVDDPSLKRGSITITQRTVSIAFSKATTSHDPIGYIGVDVNEKNVTVSATNSYEMKFDELSEIVEIKERYREIRAKIGRITRKDNRIGKQLLGKCGKREENRTAQRIHRVTKQIVNYAKENHFGIKLEKLKGIRRLYRRGNGQGTLFRGRMNTWAFAETQRQIDYKAKWECIPI